jgi:hypothetical protein
LGAWLAIQAGYVIDLSEPGGPAAKIVAGEVKVVGVKPAVE